MIARRCKTLLSQTLKNPSIYPHLQNTHFSFSYSLLFSTNPQKTSKKSTITSTHFIENYQFSPSVATKAASLLTHLKTPEKCDAVLTFFKEFGFSRMDLQKLVKKDSGRTILSANVETLKPKIKTFQDLGFSDSDIVCLVTSNTWVLLDSAKNRIFTSLFVLKNLLGSVELVVKLLKVSAWFVKHDLEKILIPNIRFLVCCGISMEQLTNHIFNFPRLFLHKPDKLRNFVVEVDEMRFNRESKLYIYAITCLASMNEVTWKKKLELFRSLGFTQDQIFQMFQRAPYAFAVSRRKITDVVQVISGCSVYGLSDIVKRPTVLTSSVEKKLKPRLQVLEILKDRNLITNSPGFSVVHMVSDEKFIERFVVPYLDELGDVCLVSRELLKKGHSCSHV